MGMVLVIGIREASDWKVFCERGLRSFRKKVSEANQQISCEATAHRASARRG